ncbi:hypothetical protein K4L44_11050 [Halosquirtibacter laminarini]|uniref:Uncharacterized protein n=1 Tax=Halosquirtibacter laminarini TaxID=3374600 RepID=A0AC61NIF5_9BACT|nr:hypothetical protein K4L44_11050 [Prolixibacteraceae bacterium]
MRVRKFLIIMAMLCGGIAVGQENFKVPFDKITFKIDGRIDYQGLDNEGDISNVDSKQFITSKVVLQTDIDIYKGLHFFYRQQFRNYNASTTDGLGGQIEKLGISYENNNWKFTVGKQWFNIGSYEALYDPNDVYIYSGVNNFLSVWKTGINAAYRFDGQELGVQVVNGSESMNIDGTFNQEDFYWNVYWYGDLGEGFVMPLVNFATDMDFDNFGILSEVGARWNFDKIKIDTDFAYVKNMKGQTLEDETFYSIPLRFYYEGKHLRPGIKYFYDNREAYDSKGMAVDGKNYTGNTIEGFINYYPFEGKDFNLHAVAGYSQYDSTINDDEQSTFKVLVGIRFGFDVFGNKH